MVSNCFDGDPAHPLGYHGFLLQMPMTPTPMTPSFALSLDTLSGWRTTLARRLDEVSRFLIDHELVDASEIGRAHV